MFGISLYKIAAVVIAVGLLVGYFKYTQDKMDTLNQAVAQKEFALKSATATIEKQQKDMQLQKETMDKLNKDFQESRAKVSELEGKFNKGNRDFGKDAGAKPAEIETRVNKATARTFKCIEETVNKGSSNGC